MRRGVLALLFFLLSSPLAAAPLEPRDRQAEDAVALLREWGVVEGYPQGGFRGDRAVSRYEAAAMVARALARLDAAGETLARREGLAGLLDGLRPELEALGVRVDSVETATEALDARVAELERFAFSGRSVTRVMAQTFWNTGQPTSGGFNYNAAVGSVAGSNFLPWLLPGVPNVRDYTNGRPLTNGTGFSSALLLDVLVRPSDEIEAELRLFGYTSQGDAVVDAVWGVTPPYLANSFTGNSTRMGLDHLRVSHEPTGLSLTAGAFLPSRISPTVYLGQPNPTVDAPAVLDSFGLLLEGEHDAFSWELFGTRLPDGNPGVGAPYRSDALGAALRWREGPWLATLSLLRAGNQAPTGGPLTMGQIALFQAPPGRLYTDWVNPPGFFAGQLGPGQAAGAGSTSDVRPVPGAANSDALSVASTFGPQGITLGSLGLEWAHEGWSLYGDFARSDYRPNRNADYNAIGHLWRLGVESRLAEETLTLQAEYRSTDPDYDPFLMAYPGTVAGVPLFRVYQRMPDWDMFWHGWTLHNTDAFPHNRKGVWLKGAWRYDPDGELTLKYRALEQVRTSLQDVRVPAGSLGAGIPNANVLGHSPGHLDFVFREYSPLSFTAGLQPLEDVRGYADSWGVQLRQAFPETPWRVEVAWEAWRFRRPSSLAPALGGSQNHVDLRSALGRLEVGYAATEEISLSAGLERGEVSGHYDPLGTYNPVAVARGSIDFTNWNTVQDIPFVEVSWDLSQDLTVGFGYRYYQTRDLVSADLFSGPPGGAGATAHPFSWSGQQFSTTVDVRF